MLIELTWQNALTLFVVALIAGFGWAIGVWLAGKITAFFNSLRKSKQV